MSNKQYNCNCNIPFDFEYLRNSLYSETNINKYKDEAITRLSSYSSRFCFSCLNELKSKNINNKNSLEEQKKIIKIPHIMMHSSNNINHIVCKNCFLSIQRVFLNCETTTQLCKICNEDHTLNKKLISRLHKTDTGGCCLIF